MGAWLGGLLKHRNNFLIVVDFSLDELSLGMSYVAE
jgi:hypothetical protein